MRVVKLVDNLLYDPLLDSNSGALVFLSPEFVMGISTLDRGVKYAKRI